MPKRSARLKQKIIKYLKPYFLGFVVLVTSVSFTLPGSAAEAGIDSPDTPIVQKANLHIVSERTDFDDQSCSATASGDAVATIDGQDSKLEADSIVYDRSAETIEALGNVRIIRHNVVTTGSKYKFKAASGDYLVTVPGTELSEVRISARRAYPPKDCHSFSFEKGKADPVVYSSDWYSIRPSHFTLGTDLQSFQYRLFGLTIYRSTCANSLLRHPLSAEDWGRDKYGIGNVLYGSQLNRDVNFLGYGTCSIIFHLARGLSLGDYLVYDDFPVIYANRRGYAESRELRAVGQTARSLGMEKPTKFFWDRHDHVAKVLPKDPIECPVLREYVTLTSPPFRRRGVPQLSELVAFNAMIRNKGRQYSDLEVEQHKDVELSGHAQ